MFFFGKCFIMFCELQVLTFITITTTTTITSSPTKTLSAPLSLSLSLISIFLLFPLLLFLFVSLIRLFCSLLLSYCRYSWNRMDLSLETPKRRSADSSPEFEFWMVGNPSYPQQELLTADELFVDGVLLPLHLLSVVHSEPDPEPELVEPPPDPSPRPPPPPPPEPSPASISSSPSSGSKRWRDIFKVGEKKGNEKERPRRESKGSGGSAAELNINIWPFSRSRSAGNGGAASGRSRASSMAGRKASSAPCSRCNSRGESSKPSAAGAGATKRWAASPGRAGLSGGVHLGRTSPVWQIRRGEKRTEPAASRGTEKANQRDKVTGGKKGSGFGGGVRVLNLNVNTCIGYRNPVSCRGNGKDGVTGGGRTASEGSGGNGSLFSFRSFFSKKVY